MKDILSFIPYGRENAVSRKYLCSVLGINDRTLRNAIKKLLRAGEPILSSSHSGGYWRSNDPEEWGKFLKECDNRAVTERKNVAKLRERYYEAAGIKVTKVREHTRKISAGRPPGQIRMEDQLWK